MTTPEGGSRILPNVYLVWLGERNDVCRKSIAHLRQVIDTTHIFDNIDECIDFITDRPEESVYMITSETYAQQLSFVIADISQLKTIYIFNQKSILPICDALKQALKDDHTNEVLINFSKSTPSTSDKNKDTLDCSFMYTQILKEILLTINFDEQHFKDFLTFCRQEFNGKAKELKYVDKIQNEYRNRTPIWWYTCESFLYSMLNKALRLMDIDIILKMGFFVCDLHQQIAALHVEQFTGYTSSDSFVVYRGQGLSQTDFDQMKQNKGGLLAFNSFLSTSKQRKVSLDFIRRATAKNDLVPVLFVMNIDPTIKHAPFANIADIGAMKREDEILFSMHSVFRIGQIEKFEDNNAIWKVELIFTSDNDPDLHLLTEQMRKEIQGLTGQYKLGNLMIRLNKLDQAESLYQLLLNETTDSVANASLFHQLAIVYIHQAKYEEAAKYHKKSLEILRKSLPPDHPDLATAYNNIGMVYASMGEYLKALEYCEKSLEICKKRLPPDHPDLATSYNNIGMVYANMGEYSKALEYYEKSLEICKKRLPPDHPYLASSYNNIGSVYNSIGEYSKALEYCEKSLEIWRKSLPPDHPLLATSSNNIGMVYDSMGKYAKALEYYEKSLEIMKKSLPPDHPDLATAYNNIGMMYANMGEYSKALEYNYKSLEIRKKGLPSDHPYLATSYNNIGSMYANMGEYSKALEYCEKSLEIWRKSLPHDHPSLASSYNNIGSVYNSIGEYSKALEYCEKSLRIIEKTLPLSHPKIKIAKENIEILKKNL